MNENRLRAAFVAVALLGAAIAGYLTYVHYEPAALVCRSGGCETVQRSRYATLLGVPVAVSGSSPTSPSALSALMRREAERLGGAALAVGSLLFALYLVYVQAAVVEAWCEWCLASDAVLLILAALTVTRAAQPPARI